ncbi:MAG: hypothetical protein V7K32_23515 [Nostoc sp.]|uniref:hypothetical protein n=1 Tax=Nostoc sp. TaxID=1180 RepID=UPI002FFCD07F
MNETTGNFLAVENDSVSYTESDDLELSKSLDNQHNAQSPLLPRSGWQNRRAFLTALIKAKRSLDIAEITSFLESETTIFGDRSSR